MLAFRVLNFFNARECKIQLIKMFREMTTLSRMLT